MQFALTFFFIVIITCQDDKSFSVYVNNVSPYSNPSETYQYYMLPFCAPKRLSSADQTLGQALSGDRKMGSLYNMTFKNDMNRTLLCMKTMSSDDLEQFHDVIDQNYMSEFYIGDFRMHDQIGLKENGTYFLKTHIKFNIFFSPDQLHFYHANISQPEFEDYVNISEKKITNISFFYSVSFQQVESRAEIDKEDNFEFEGESKIQWESLVIKFFIIIVLVFLICIYVSRLLKNDFIQLSDDENNRGQQIIYQCEIDEEVGWKLVRRDALRTPKNKILLSAFLGTGVHFIILVISQTILGVFGLYYGHKGSIKTTGLLIYAFTGYFNGFYTGKYYKFFGGKKWTLNMALAISIFPGSILSTWIAVNSLAWYFNSTATIPFSALLLIGFLFFVIYMPLTIIGNISGRLKTIDQLPNIDRKVINRPVPTLPIKHHPIIHFFISGFIPFCSVYEEVNFVYTSTWGHYTFHLYGMIAIAFIMVLIVVGCIQILLTYTKLKYQDYNWQWSCFLNGGASSLFLMIYSLYYYSFQSQMHGLIQGSFFYGYTLLASIVIFMMLGAIGFLSSLKFVFYIYSQARSD